MAEFPALPLWTDAYLADTFDLSESEHGLYLLMLMLAWRRPDCALPDDMVWLRRSLQACCGGQLHGNRFNRIVPRLLRRFFTLEDSKWRQKRLSKERAYLRKRSQRQSENAKKRWAAAKQDASENSALDHADAEPPGSPPTPTPRPRSTGSIESEKKESPSPIERESPVESQGRCAPTPCPPRKDSKKSDRAARPATRGPYVWAGRVIRLTREDYERWKAAYSGIPDFDAELQAADDHYAENPPRGGRWFFPVSSWLKRAHNNPLGPPGSGSKSATGAAAGPTEGSVAETSREVKESLDHVFGSVTDASVTDASVTDASVSDRTVSDGSFSNERTSDGEPDRRESRAAQAGHPGAPLEAGAAQLEPAAPSGARCRGAAPGPGGHGGDGARDAAGGLEPGGGRAGPDRSEAAPASGASPDRLAEAGGGGRRA